MLTHCLFSLHTHSASCKMLGWMKLMLESRLQGKYQQSQICRLHNPNGRKRRGNKKPLDKCERGEWKSWLKTQHSKSIMANKETMETVTHLILGSKINVVGSKINDIKRCLLLGRKSMANLNSILKSRDIILLTNVHIVKAMISPVVMYGCERWIIKEAEHWRTDAFKLWCWRRF